jgi:antitoxin (DNA-binding transcriptional repressor) of toxin-antitoxin stability system
MAILAMLEHGQDARGTKDAAELAHSPFSLKENSCRRMAGAKNQSDSFAVALQSAEVRALPFESIISTMAKDVIYVSDAEAANNLPSLLDRVCAGAEVVIERDSRPVAVVRSADAPRGRLISESIALAKAHAAELGYEPTMDPDFAADLDEIINRHRQPLNPPSWD